MRRPFHDPGTPDRLEALRESFGGFGVGQLLALRTGKVITTQQAIGSAQPSTFAADVEEALRCYEAGQTLTFNLDPRHPKVEPWYETFTAHLAPRPNRSSITAFCTPPGRGTVMHFDRYDVYNVALCGTKHWRIGRAPSVAAPLHECQIGKPHPRELRAYWTPEPGADAPSEVETIAMTPGSVLYLPRGYAHETIAGDEAAVGISFVVDVHSTFELITSALRMLMLREESLRASANDLWHGGSASHLEDDLALVARLVKSLRAEDLAPPPASASVTRTTRLRRSPLALRTLETLDGTRAIVARRIDQEEAARLDERHAAILDWIDAQPRSFDAQDLPPELDANPEYEAARLCKLFGVLVETGYLTMS